VLSAIAYMGLNFGVMLFILNGLGYLGLLAALQLPIPQLARFRSTARWALIAYAALTIVLFFIMAPEYTTIGYIDKAIEVALIALLLADAYTAYSKPSSGTPSTRARRGRDGRGSLSEQRSRHYHAARETLYLGYEPPSLEGRKVPGGVA
jgi:hypothetical protein